MSKVYTEIKYLMLPDGGLEFVSEKSFEYEGPVALCLRQAQNQAADAASTAAQTGATLGSRADTEGAQLSPFFSREMQTEHGFTPGQTDELLTAAGAGTGGATSGLEGQAQLEQARTRNASGFTKGLDEVARDRNKALAANSEGVAAQDVMQAKQENQEGAQGLQGLYGTNVKGQLEAMGQVAPDVNAETNASQHGWLQNLDQTIAALGTAASGAGALKTAFS